MKLMTLLVILAPLFLFWSNKESVQQLAARYKTQLRRSTIWLCLTVLATTLAIELGIARHDQIFHDEATVLCIAAAFYHGQQMYPMSNTPVEYALLYGPMTYLVYLPPMILRSDHLGVFLAWVAVAFGSSLLTVALSLKRRFTLPIALCCTVLLAAYAVNVLSYEWAIRGDVWVLLFTALGLWASRLDDRWTAAILITVFGAILANLKLPLFAVGLLPSVALWGRDRTSHLPALLSAACMPLLVLVPFADRRISLQGYCERLADASHHGLSVYNFSRNLPFVLYFLLPTFGLLWLALQQNRSGTRMWLRTNAAYLAALTCVLLIAIITGAKYGAGPWHLMSVAVPLVDLDATLFNISWSSTPRSGGSYLRMLALPAAIAVVMLPACVLAFHRGIKGRLVGPENFSRVSMPAVERDVENILRDHAGEDIAMGYTDLRNYTTTSARPLLQLHGQSLFIDAVARNEADLISKPLPLGVLRALETCQTKLWILPVEGVPFSMESLYHINGSIKEKSLYPASVCKAFLTHYHRIATSHYFAIWQCNGT